MLFHSSCPGQKGLPGGTPTEQETPMTPASMMVPSRVRGSWHIQPRLPEVLKKEPLGAQPAWHSSGSAKGGSLGEEKRGSRESGIWVSRRVFWSYGCRAGVPRGRALGKASRSRTVFLADYDRSPQALLGPARTHICFYKSG
jgi:hypothetical protein